jgi:predicted small metal-binding protein
VDNIDSNSSFVIDPPQADTTQMRCTEIVLVERFKLDSYIVIVMYILACQESGLDCDFVIKGDTKEEFLINGANHAIQKHGMRVEDVYLNDIPLNLLCHSFSEEA